MISSLIRWFGTVVILCIVWKHAHWSVALVLSLMAIEAEVTTICIKAHTQMFRDIGVDNWKLGRSLKKAVDKTFA